MAESKLTIYGDFLSQPFRAVISFCAVNKIENKVQFVNLFKREHLAEDFKKINIYGKIPAIVLSTKEKEFNLSESGAILRFLSDYFKVEEKWYPREDRFRRAEIDQWLDWHQSNTRLALSNYFFKNTFLKKLEAAGIKRKVFETEEMVQKVLQFLNKILKDKKYIVDNEISIADLIISSEINQLCLMNYDFSKVPNVQSYLERINRIPEIKDVNSRAIKIAKKINIRSAKF